MTLLGPGGSGKTRLAIEAAARELDRFPDGVWLVELAPVMSPELVINELADTWGLRASIFQSYPIPRPPKPPGSQKTSEV